MAPSGSGPRRLRGWLLVAVAALLLLGLGWIGYQALRQQWASRHHQDAAAALGEQDYAAATDHLARCLQVWPHDRETLLLAAQSARRADRLQDALRFQERCAELHGNSPELLLERQLLAAQQGQLAGLEPSLRRMVTQNDPNAVLILEALTQGYIKTFRAPEAFEAADALLRRQEDHVRAWLWRGWARERLRHTDEAIADYRQAVQLRPDSVWGRLSLGELLLESHRYPEALEQFDWLRERKPDDAAIGLGTARCLRGLGQTDRARGLLDQLGAAFPNEGLILSERGQLALEEGHWQEAERWLRRAAVLIPFDRQTHYALSRSLQKQGRTEEAGQHLRTYEQIGTDQKRLGKLEEEISGGGPAAERRCEAGVLCLRLGRDEAGERYLLAALQDDPSYAPAHRALAEHYEKIGRSDLAARHRAAAPP